MKTLLSINRINRLFILLVLFGLVSLQLSTPTKAQAACNIYASMTPSAQDVTWSTNCTIDAGTIDGVDKGTTANSAQLTLNGGTITINNTAQLTVGSLNLKSGAISIQAGGSIKIGDPLYVVDADGDGFAAKFNLYSSSATGRVRLSTLTSYNQTDCYDNNTNAYPNSTYCGATKRGDGSFDYNCDSVESKCAPVLTYSADSTIVTTQHSTGSCSAGTYQCSTDDIPTYPQTGVNCGLTGGDGCDTMGGVGTQCNKCDIDTGGHRACTAITPVTQTCN